MAQIRISHIDINPVPAGIIEVTVSYRLAIDPDVPESYIEAATNVQVQPSGELVDDVLIQGLEDATDYIVRVVPECGGPTAQVGVHTPPDPDYSCPSGPCCWDFFNDGAEDGYVSYVDNFTDQLVTATIPAASGVTITSDNIISVSPGITGTSVICTTTTTTTTAPQVCKRYELMMPGSAMGTWSGQLCSSGEPQFEPIPADGSSHWTDCIVEGTLSTNGNPDIIQEATCVGGSTTTTTTGAPNPSVSGIIKMNCSDVNCTQQGHIIFSVVLSAPYPFPITLHIGQVLDLTLEGVDPNTRYPYMGTDIYTAPTGTGYVPSDYYNSPNAQGFETPFEVIIPANTVSYTAPIPVSQVGQTNNGWGRWVCQHCQNTIKDLYVKVMEVGYTANFSIASSGHQYTTTAIHNV